MCGIVGYTGHKQAQQILLSNLQKLEYRGYDSCGIALDGCGITVYKDTVRVAELSRSLPPHDSTVGIGHTRWATHGMPSKVNAHPHCDCTGNIAVVHNGVITNYEQLKKQLIAEGHTFHSETDTEVVAHLVEKHLQDNTDLVKAVSQAMGEIEGSYAVIVMVEGEPGLIVARKDSPLIIGLGHNENYIASDVTGVLEYTNRVIYLEDGDVGTVAPDRIIVQNAGQTIDRPENRIDWTAEQAQKSGYEHYMLKEIYEQPQVLRNTLTEYLSSPSSRIENRKLSSVMLLACGTSYHAALVGKYLFEQLAGTATRAEMASEFNYLDKYPLDISLAIGITQSGETADTIKALKKAREIGANVQVITNVVNSTASRIADRVIYTRAGPEMSVAATKSFTAQLLALYWMALTYTALDIRTFDNLVLELRRLPEKIRQVLSRNEIIEEFAGRLSSYENIFYIGRGINYPIAHEGALKLKEISYIHSEAYAAGELKHGPFALLTKDTPVIAIVSPDNSYNAMLTSMKEIKARGSPLLVLAPETDDMVHQVADMVVGLPRINTLLSPFINTVAVQLFAYYAAKNRCCAIDYPRNLAKSVTVE